MRLDFRGADINNILTFFSVTAGVTIVNAPALKGPVTLISAQSLSLDEAFAVLDATLRGKRYQLSKDGPLLRVVPLRRQTSFPALAPSTPTPPATATAPAEQQQGRRRRRSGQSGDVRVFTLKQADATKIAQIINDLFRVRTTAAMPGQGQPGPGRRGPGNMAQARGGQAQADAADVVAEVRATADTFTNSVVVTASAEYMTKIEQLLRQLDVDATTTTQTQVYPLQYETASVAASALQSVVQAMAPGVRTAAAQNTPFEQRVRGGNRGAASAAAAQVVAETRSNSVIVTGTPETQAVVKDILAQLDQPVETQATTFVYPLANAQAAEVATLLQQSWSRSRAGSANRSIRTGTLAQSTITGRAGSGRQVNLLDLAGQVTVVPDVNTNSLIISATPDNYEAVRAVLAELDAVPEQVHIELVIAEVALDASSKLGLQWAWAQNTAGGSSTTAGANLPQADTSGSSFRFSLTGRSLQATLDALKTDQRFSVLSTPRICTTNNREAEINISQRVPYVTNFGQTDSGAITSSVAYQDVGVILTVTPRIADNGLVTMEVRQEANELQGYTTFNAPIVSQRMAATTVMARDGETVVLGGIISEGKTRSVNKVPVLGDIPVLGELFRSKSDTTTKTELLVFLTPRVIKNPEQSALLTSEEARKVRVVLPPVPSVVPESPTGE